MSDGRKMTARITCTEEIKNTIRHVADGAGVNYDEMLRYLLSQAGIEAYMNEIEGKMVGIKRMSEIQEFKEKKQ